MRATGSFSFLGSRPFPLVPSVHAHAHDPPAATHDGFEEEGQKKFRTSGNVVVVLTALSVAAYASLIALTIRLEG